MVGGCGYGVPGIGMDDGTVRIEEGYPFVRISLNRDRPADNMR